MLETNGAKMDENNGVYIVSSKKWDDIEWELSDMGIECETDGNNHLITIGKSEIIIHVNESRSRGNNKPMTETESEKRGVKSKNNGYIIVYKSNTDKNEKTNKSISTCAEIKSWLKSIDKKSMQYLRIYDALKNPCRLSAWIERG